MPIAAIQDAARILAHRRQLGLQGSCLLAGLRPASVHQALAIQDAVTAHLGWRVGAWKCALPQADRVTAAPIYAPTIHDAAADHPCPAWARQGKVRVEPELAFVLGHDLPARATAYTPQEVDLAIARTHLALELIDSRYAPTESPTFADKLADGLANQGLYLGPAVDADVARTTKAMALTVVVPGEPDMMLNGLHPDGLPRGPLYWLVEHLRARGAGLLAGQAVITGAYVGSFCLPLDQDIAVHYGHLGQLAVRLSALTPS